MKFFESKARIVLSGAALCLAVLSACERSANKGQAAAAVPTDLDDDGEVSDDGMVPASTTELALPEGSPWQSQAACLSALKAGKRLSRSANQVRLGSWNLRWFPDGVPGYKARGSGTDIQWAACAIAFMKVDVLAVQEIKTHANARTKLAELLKALDGFTLGKWQAIIDDCPQPAGQHVGLLFDSKRARASDARTYASINPHGEACKDQLRPGYGAYFSFPGGLDLHIISVHLKSGAERRSLDLRTRSITGFAPALSAAHQLAVDDDVVILGDFNAMGCRHCSPAVSPSEERNVMEAELGGLARAMTLVPAASNCSEYHRGSGSLLDIAAVNKSLRELPPSSKLTASGICGELSCSVLPNGARPRALAALSDHCPVYFDLEDRDID